MNRLREKNIYGVVVAQRDSEPTETERLIDLTENQIICHADFCAYTWKPVPTTNDLVEDVE